MSGRSKLTDAFAKQVLRASLRASRKLAVLRARGTPVRIYRDSIEKHAIDGIVVASNSRFCVVQWISGELRLDGWEIIRTCDISRVEESKNRSRFYRKILTLRGEKVSRPRNMDLEDWPAILTWLGSRFPLLVVHQEFTHPNECQVGQVTLVSEITLTMRTVGLYGGWLSWPFRCRVRTITRVDFGGGYEGALALVNGARPKSAPVKKTRHART